MTELVPNNYYHSFVLIIFHQQGKKRYAGTYFLHAICTPPSVNVLLLWTRYYPVTTGIVQINGRVNFYVSSPITCFQTRGSSKTTYSLIYNMVWGKRMSLPSDFSQAPWRTNFCSSNMCIRIFSNILHVVSVVQITGLPTEFPAGPQAPKLPQFTGLVQ